jgi:hypothetical protein
MSFDRRVTETIFALGQVSEMSTLNCRVEGCVGTKGSN